jgi:DDE superfamily endonuclease
LLARARWPKFVSFQDDVTYRKDFKWDAYDGKRVVFFDNTNIPMRKPSDAEAQRATYSLYYSGNVGKGAVFIQPCGWIGSHEIWNGAVSDTNYMQSGDVFDSFNQYLHSSPFEDDSTRDVTFTLVLDKGYRVTLEAQNEGGHFVLQPVFQPSDRQFTTVEVLVTSSVASDRGGNERAVMYLKLSDYIKKGLLNNESAD